MNAKEKAKDLVDKMYYSGRYLDGENYIPKAALLRAKNCAIILVNEMIIQAKDNAEIGYVNYWENVKNEIDTI